MMVKRSAITILLLLLVLSAFAPHSPAQAEDDAAAAITGRLLDPHG
jgi:hypothetical protein